MGPLARGSVANIATLLDSPVSQVVRQALDTLGAIGCDLGPALPKIERLLTTTNLEWLEAQVMRGWTAEDQVRMNAAAALLNAVNAGENLDDIERIASAALRRQERLRLGDRHRGVDADRHTECERKRHPLPLATPLGRYADGTPEGVLTAYALKPPALSPYEKSRSGTSRIGNTVMCSSRA